MIILGDKKQRRVNHWKEIQSRVVTHEGESLSGKKGEDYRKKWGEKYLGRAYQKTDFNKPRYQKELEK